MEQAPRIILFGKQGAGKGTQAHLLLARKNLEHLSTGDIFRAAIKENTPAEPEPYKGKGIRYEGEHVRRKAGKSAK